MVKAARYFPVVLVIFHIIGFALFMTDSSAARLSYINLLLCGALVFLAESKLVKLLPVFCIIFIAGFLLELIGTKTGYLFGDYAYGTSLGLRWYGVPLIIGLNWFAIVVSACNVSRRFNASVEVQAILAGLLATLLDFLIEPVAVRFGFWHWRGTEIPVYNYVCWFIFSAAFSYLYLNYTSGKNTTAFYLFFIWTVFFISLNIF